jgi:hypothetical protein
MRWQRIKAVKGYLDVRCEKERTVARLFVVDKRIGEPAEKRNFEVIEGVNCKKGELALSFPGEVRELTIAIGMPG